MRRRLWTLLALLTSVSGEYLMGGHLDNNANGSKSGKIDEASSSALERRTRLDDLDLDLVAEESTVGAAKTSADDEDYEDGVPRYRIPYSFAFNGGKPFSLEKDPITGKIDFEKAPPVKALNYTSGDYREDKESAFVGDSADRDGGSAEEGAYDGAEREKIASKDRADDVGPNEINAYTPNFHDFLNLPVHYSSDKYGNDKYPLISSSYANTKVQSGANSYSVYNHRPTYHSENEVVMYARPTKGPYVAITKTSTYKTTTVHDVKAKWTSTTARPSTTATPAPSTTISTTKAPVVTTWKPSSLPTAFHSIAETDDERNILPIEKLHATHRHPIGNVIATTQSSAPPKHRQNNAEAAPEKQQTNTHRYKNQSTMPNLVLSQTARPGAELRPPAQNEEYGESYSYEFTEGEVDGEEEGNNSEETDYLVPFQELLRENVTSTTTSSRPTTKAATTTTTTATTITTTTTASTTAGSSIGTTMMSAAPSVVRDQPSRSTPPASQKDTFAHPLQFPKVPQQQHPQPDNPHNPQSSSFGAKNDRRQSVITTERHDGVISGHGYGRPNWMAKPASDGLGTVIESTSNIVIPPDQDTVSFVLGNRQNVEGGYYSVGTAVGENPYGSSSDIQTWPVRHETQPPPAKDVNYEHPSVSTEPPSPDRVAQKWRSPASSPLQKTNEVVDPVRSQGVAAPTNAVVIHGDTTKDTRTKEKNPGYVVFPDDEAKNKNPPLTEEHIVIVNEADGSVRELPPKTMANNKTKPNLPQTGGGDSLPQLAEDLTPPDVESSKPPSYYHHYQFDTPRPDHLRPPPPPPQRVPLPPPLPSRVKPGLAPDATGLRKRPYPPDAKLPNILPQFRPNAKTSHGHRGPDAIGTMPAGLPPPPPPPPPLPPRIRQPSGHPLSRRPPLPASYLQRLKPPPPPPPIHAIRLPAHAPKASDSVAPPRETEHTAIRRFRPPHGGGPPISRGSLEENPSSKFGHEERNAVGGSEGGENGDRIRRTDERTKSEDEREIDSSSSEMYPEEPPMIPPRPPIFPKRRTADHPRVATLQMIQHHGEHLVDDEGGNDDEITEVAQPVVEPVLAADEAERRKSDNHRDSAEQPVYVVYPVTTAVNIHPDDSNEKEVGSVVVGTLGPQRPLPPDTLLQDSSAEQEEKTPHTVYGRPPVAPDFPYPLERPDPSSLFPGGVKETPLLVPSDQRQQVAPSSTTTEREIASKDEQDALNVIPYLPYRKKSNDHAAISVTLHRAASSTTSPPASTTIVDATPIAYVYTPTQAAHRLDDELVENDDKQPVLLPSQQPSSSSSSAPAPQNFMAPFVPSLSAEAPSRNGWSVVEPPVVDAAERKGQDGDNAGDDDHAAASSSDTETQTEKEFDPENFKPQFFGGFKPIYEFPPVADTGDRDAANVEMNMPRRARKLSPLVT